VSCGEEAVKHGFSDALEDIHGRPTCLAAAAAAFAALDNGEQIDVEDGHGRLGTVKGPR
jgi:hypothetical protein